MSLNSSLFLNFALTLLLVLCREAISALRLLSLNKTLFPLALRTDFPVDFRISAIWNDVLWQLEISDHRRVYEVKKKSSGHSALAPKSSSAGTSFSTELSGALWKQLGWRAAKWVLSRCLLLWKSKWNNRNLLQMDGAGQWDWTSTVHVVEFSRAHITRVETKLQQDARFLLRAATLRIVCS